MTWQTYIANLTTILFLTTNPFLLVENTQYKPQEDLESPPTTKAGKTRDSKKCPQDDDYPNGLSLTALIPNPEIDKNKVQLTVAKSPQIFMYVPPTSAELMQILIKKEDGVTDIYRTEPINIPAKSGVIAISIPEAEAKLEIGKNYRWIIRVICNPKKRRDDLVASGWLRRIEPNSNLADRLKNAEKNEYPSIYASNGIWLDAVKNLAELRLAEPDNLELENDWQELLESAGLNDLVEAPLLGE
ncbi:DUF928 domain-containing protein [Okeania sp. KiyG1]|uniref:DUF928 domain-containing protein n=1 Tax=Okeania sp. KiyG1 TaxID=2720165 RepID=UPI001924FEB3|nr:DUF928 domain-containing protein [Okeania sp. KiyG1]GGA23954.1 hypothetical protein CYANOKiyG1_39380 [Okeania sp. KiyG1]